jgi:hypothetical protein
MIHPGLLGALGGAATGGVAGGLGHLSSVFGGPTMTKYIQNPLIEKIFKMTEPYYYGLGRSYIGQKGKKNKE